jgi:hypothetical protein
MALVDDVLSQLSSAAANTTQDKEQLGSLLDKINAQQGIESNAAEKGAEADKQAIIARAKAQVAVQDASSKVAGSLGTDVTQANERLSNLAGDIWNLKDKRDKAQAEYTDIVDSKFFDNPIGWLVGQFRAPYVAAELDQANSNLDAATTFYKNINQATQEGIQTQIALKKIETADTMKAATDKVDAQLQHDKAVIAIESLRTNVQGLKEFREMNQQALTNKVQAYHVANSEREYALQLRRLADDEAYHNWLMSKENKTAQEEKQLMNWFKMGSALIATPERPAIAPGTPDAAVSFMLKDPNNSDYARLAISTAIKSMGQSGQGQQLVVGSYSDLQHIKQVTGGIPDAYAWTQKFGDAVDGAVAESLKTNLGMAGGGGAGSLDAGDNKTKISVQQLKKLYDDTAVKVAGAQMANIKPSDGSNIYAAPSLQLLMHNPQVANNPLVKNYLSQVPNTNIKDVEQIFGATAQLVKDGKMSFDEAVKNYTSLYSAAVQANNAVNNYAGLGLPNQLGYRVLSNAGRPSGFLNTPPMGLGKTLVDHTDPVQVSAMLSKYMSASTRYSADQAVIGAVSSVANNVANSAPAQKIAKFYGAAIDKKNLVPGFMQDNGEQ